MKRYFVILMLLALAISTGCSSSRSVARTNWNIGAPRTFQETLAFNNDKDLDQLKLEIDVKLDTGNVILTATNPNGEIVLSETVTTSLKTDLEWKAISGEWELLIDATEASGELEFVWTGTK